MKKNIIKFTIILSNIYFLLPKFILAQQTGTSRLYEMLQTFQWLLGRVVPIIFGLSVVYFFWGTANFILNSNNEKTRRENINKMVFGVVALFVFVSIYGILRVLQSLINL